MTTPEPCPWQRVGDTDYHTLDVYSDGRHIYFLQTAAPEWERICDVEPEFHWTIQIWRRPVLSSCPVEHLLARSYEAGDRPGQAFGAWLAGINDARGLSAREVAALISFPEPEWLEESFYDEAPDERECQACGHLHDHEDWCLCHACGRDQCGKVEED